MFFAVTPFAIEWVDTTYTCSINYLLVLYWDIIPHRSLARGGRGDELTLKRYELFYLMQKYQSTKKELNVPFKTADLPSPPMKWRSDWRSDSTQRFSQCKISDMYLDDHSWEHSTSINWSVVRYSSFILFYLIILAIRLTLIIWILILFTSNILNFKFWILLILIFFYL